MRAQLAVAGYTHVTQVVSPGEFSVRGGLIDLFPMGSALPYRLDLFGDEIESIRTFDVDTQRTLYRCRRAPAARREFPLDEAGRTRFRGRFREVFEATRRARRCTRTSATASCRAARVLPAAVLRGDGDFLDYLPQDPLVVLHGDVAGASTASGRTPSRATGCCAATRPPPVAPSELFVPPDGFRVR